MERGGNAIIQLIVQIVMARLLAPEQFGALAIMLVFVNVGVVSRKLTMPSSNRGIWWSKLFMWPLPFFIINRSRQLRILGDGRFPPFRRNGSYTNIWDTIVHQAVAGGEPIGVHDGVPGHLALDHLHQRPAGDVRDDPGADLAAAPEQAEDDRLAPRPAAPDAPRAPRAEAALVGLDLAAEGTVGLAGLRNAGAEHAVVAVDRVAVEARQGGRRERRRVGAEQPQQLPELALREVRVFDVLVLRRLLAAHGLILEPFRPLN